ncbi:Palmitoyltransferase [Aphelenchoides besseyi]|nr:Palmitoyltransferase [Aphelenchoides besseyi]
MKYKWRDLYKYSHELRNRRPLVGYIVQQSFNSVLVLQFVANVYEFYVYTFIVCGHLLESWFQVSVYMVVFCFLFVMMIWSLVVTKLSATSHVDPIFKVSKEVDERLKKNTPRTEDGVYIPDYSSPQELVEQYRILRKWTYENELTSHIAEVDFRGRIRYCYICNAIKSDRARHCSSSGFCTKRYDHYCVFLNSCICYGNYKAYFLYLFYGWLTHLWFVYELNLASLCFRIIITTLEGIARFYVNGNYLRDVYDLLQVGVCIVLQVHFGFHNLGELFCYHLQMVLKNETTVEQLKPPFFHEDADYNLGIYLNLRAVLGWGFWLFPLDTKVDDGTHFPIDYKDPNLPEEEKFVCQKIVEESQESGNQIEIKNSVV